jgi:hypothetical protein
VLHHRPAEPKIQSAGTRRVKIKAWRAEDPCLPNDSLNEGSADPAPAMLWRDEDPGKPWSKLGSCGHVMLDETGGTQHLISSQRDERGGNFAMAAGAFDSRSAIFHGFARAEVAPLRMKPVSDCGYELTMIGKILDGHMQGILTRKR